VLNMNKGDLIFLRQETGAGVMECQRALRQTNGDVAQSLTILRESGLQLASKKADRATKDGIAYAAVFGHRGVILEVNTETDFVAGNQAFISYVARIAQSIAEHRPDDIAGLMESRAAADGTTVRELVQKMVLSFRENIVLRRFAVLEGDMPVAFMHQNGKYGVILALEVEGNIDGRILEDMGRELAMQIAAMAPQHISRAHLRSEALDDMISQIREEVSADPSLSQKSPQVQENIVAGRIYKFYRTNCLLEQAYIRDDTISVDQFLKRASAGFEATVNVTGFFRYEKAEGLNSEDEMSNSAIPRWIAR
jgi:elongation factor Ts